LIFNLQDFVCAEWFFNFIYEAVGLEHLPIVQSLEGLYFSRSFLVRIMVGVSDVDFSSLSHGVCDVIHDTREDRRQWSGRFYRSRGCGDLFVLG
jgi:hypothetical protein